MDFDVLKAFMKCFFFFLGGDGFCRIGNILQILCYTPYEGLILANQNSRKLGVFDRKLLASYVYCSCYFDKY